MEVMEEATAITEVTTVTTAGDRIFIFSAGTMTEAAMCRLIAIVDLKAVEQHTLVAAEADGEPQNALYKNRPD